MCASIRSRFGGVRIMKLKRLLDYMFDKRMLPMQRKCLLGDIIRYDGSATCGDCEYRCFNSCCTVGMSVLK